jgi:Leucine-rich repeat (LRR) protein
MAMSPDESSHIDISWFPQAPAATVFSLGISEALRRVEVARKAGAEELDLGGLGLAEITEDLVAKIASLDQIKVLYLGLSKKAANKPHYNRTDEDKKLCNVVRALPIILFNSLPYIEKLYLEHNQLTALPGEIGSLPNLQELYLDNNQLASLPGEIGQLRRLQGLSLDDNELASLPGEIGHMTDLLALSLNNNRLTSLPSEIGRLKRLQGLSLRSNQLTSLPAEIGQMTDLRHLYLENNQLASLPQKIGRLTRLQRLYLDNNQLTSLPGEIGQQAGLQMLTINNNQLASLPREIGQLKCLMELSLDTNRLTSLPGEIGQITNLRGLYLDNNQLASLPGEIGQLTGLRGISLDNNLLAVLPDEICQMTSLRMLSVDNNQLATLPDNIGQMANLQRLSLDNNQLKSLPGGIGRMMDLVGLYLDDNQLAAPPREIGRLTGLQELYLDNNQLAALPGEIGHIEGLRGKDWNGKSRFSVLGNPLPSLPEGLSVNGDAVLDFLKGLLAGAEPCNEIKIVLVGKGKAGKTSLFHRLKDDTFIPNRPHTVGLEIGCLALVPPNSAAPQLQLNVWDFAGQSEYYSAQQFFFTSRALYLFLWNQRQGLENSNAGYWLSLLQKRVGQVKVLMVATHCFEEGGLGPQELNTQELNMQELRKLDNDFPGMLLPGVEEIDNAAPPYRIQKLKARLYAEAWKLLANYQLHLPRTWIDARDTILSQRQSQTHIDFATFEKDCHLAGVTGSAVQTLATMLSKQGRLVYHGGDRKLANTVVLNAEWLTKAFACVRQDKEEESPAIDAPERASETRRPARSRGGFLHRDRLAAIWKDYPNDKYDLLLGLMIEHGLSYAVTEDEWHVPELVPVEEPKGLPWREESPWRDVGRFDGEAARRGRVTQFCHLGTEYDELHDLNITHGLIAEIIQRSNYYFTNRNWFWQEGLFIRHPIHDTEALITLAQKRVLRIETRGVYPGGLMDVMRGAIESVILDRWPAAKQAKKPLYEFKAPCPHDGCNETFSVSDLTEREAGKQGCATINCPGGHECDVTELLRGVRREAPAWAVKLLTQQDAAKRGQVAASAEQQAHNLSLQEALSGPLNRLLSFNVDMKQCLNLLIGHATAQRLPRIYHLQPVDFDISVPGAIHSPAVRSRVVRLVIWCEWEDQPVPEAFLDISANTALVHELKQHGAAALSVLCMALAVWSGADTIDSLLTGKYSGLLEFMRELTESADDIEIHQPHIGLPGDEPTGKGAERRFDERHLTGSELDAKFAARLQEAALAGGMEQALCPDGQWRWVSKKAAKRLTQTEPREIKAFANQTHDFPGGE